MFCCPRISLFVAARCRYQKRTLLFYHFSSLKTQPLAAMGWSAGQRGWNHTGSAGERKTTRPPDRPGLYHWRRGKENGTDQRKSTAFPTGQDGRQCYLCSRKTGKYSSKLDNVALSPSADGRKASLPNHMEILRRFAPQNDNCPSRVLKKSLQVADLASRLW